MPRAALMWLIKRKTADLLNFMENVPRQSPLLFFLSSAGCLAEFTNVYLSGPSSLLTQSLDEMCS